MTSIYMFIVYLCLPEMDLEEEQNGSRPHLALASENLKYFLTHALIPLLSIIFALAHETICIF